MSHYAWRERGTSSQSGMVFAFMQMGDGTVRSLYRNSLTWFAGLGQIQGVNLSLSKMIKGVGQGETFLLS